MALTLTSISALLARKGNDYINEQLNFVNKFMAMDGLPKKNYAGVSPIVQVRAGGMSSTGIIVSDQFYDTPDVQDAATLRVAPVSFAGIATIGEDIVEMLTAKQDSINIVKDQVGVVTKNILLDLGRSQLDGYGGGVVTAAAISGTSTATLTLQDVNFPKPKKLYEVYSQDKSTKLFSFIVTQIASRDGLGGCTVLVNSVRNGAGALLTSGTFTLGAGIWVKGYLTPSAANRFVSLADACGSGDIYGQNVPNADWSGTETFAGGPLNLEMLRELDDDASQRSGLPMDVTTMGRLVFQDYEQLHISGRRYVEGDTMDAFGNNATHPEFRGKPIIVDDNCPARSVFMHSKMAGELCEFKKLSPINRNGKDVEDSQVQYSVIIKYSGMWNQRITQRNAFARLRDVVIS